MSGFRPPWNGRSWTPKRSFAVTDLDVAGAPIVLKKSASDFL